MTNGRCSETQPVNGVPEAPAPPGRRAVEADSTPATGHSTRQRSASAMGPYSIGPARDWLAGSTLHQAKPHAASVFPPERAPTPARPDGYEDEILPMGGAARFRQWPHLESSRCVARCDKTWPASRNANWFSRKPAHQTSAGKNQTLRRAVKTQRLPQGMGHEGWRVDRRHAHKEIIRRAFNRMSCDFSHSNQ